MRAYQQRPVIVSAEQFRSADEPWPAAVHGEVDHDSPVRYGCVRIAGVCTEVVDGEWLVTQPDGTIALVPDALFRRLYAPLPEPLPRGPARPRRKGVRCC